MRPFSFLFFLFILSGGCVIFFPYMAGADEARNTIEKEAHIKETDKEQTGPSKMNTPKSVFDAGTSIVHRLVDDHGLPIRGEHRRVALIDSGLDLVNFKGKVVDRYNFISQTEDISDDNGHGTIVANIVWSVAPKADILSYKVLDQDLNGNEVHILAALKRAVQNKADVINLSFGDPKVVTYEPSNQVVIAIEKAVQKGICVVVSAGNKHKRWGVFSPGGSPKAITVGAGTDDLRSVADYSNCGPILGTWEMKPDFLAPGTDGEGSSGRRGTSFAAPYVSGYVALLRQKHPTWDPSKLKSALATTATILREDDKAISPTAQGSGLVHIHRAIETKSIFYPTHISFGPMEIEDLNEKQVKGITIENVSERRRNYTLQWKWDKGDCNEIRGEVASSLVVDSQEKKEAELCLITTSRAKKGLYSSNLCIRSDTQVWHIPIVVLISEAGIIPHPRDMHEENS